MHSSRQVRIPARRANRTGTRPAFVGGAIALIALAALTLAAATLPSAPAAQAAPDPIATRTPAAHGQPDPGTPAIRLLKKDGGPITAVDAVKYIQAAGMPRTLNHRSPITDIRAELLTSAEIRTRLHGESTGYADSALLWFVQMRGTFVFPGPPHHPALTAHDGYQVFDPVTGNLVMFGGDVG